MPSLKNLTREEYNQYFREYRAKNRKKMREYNRVYNKANRIKHNYEYERLWGRKRYESEEERAKTKARNDLNSALKNSYIYKRACLYCPNKKTVAHHFDYSKPLQVIWLCKSHHSTIHPGKQKLKQNHENPELINK